MGTNAILPMPRLCTIVYNPLNCTCWAFPQDEYCEYCDLVCDASLEDFECDVGDWFGLGEGGEFLPFLQFFVC